MPSVSRKIVCFRRMVWSHYRRHGRFLPWRETRDPYRILVSELMLQQTQVERVIPKYQSFLRRFPDIVSLAEAPLADVLREWQGLGYNRRALYLKRTAQEIVARHGSAVPRDATALARLPGIGPATAGAVSAFIFQEPCVFIETNIRRVFLHFFFPKKRGVDDRDILALVKKTLNHRNPREWYYALMDYGVLLGAKQKKEQNPNRRSRHYSVQPRFAGSRRQLRGKTLKAYLANPSFSLPALARQIMVPLAQVRTAYATLQAEGLIH